MSQIAVFFIGSNGFGEFGLGHTDCLPEFKECPEKSITKVFFSRYCYIFSDNHFRKIWSAGYNGGGQCGVGKKDEIISTYTRITYFEQNKINIQKICSTKFGFSTYFISDKGELYGCGLINRSSSIQYQPAVITGVKNVVDIQSDGPYNTIVLCASDKISLILSCWCRKYKAPQDIMYLFFYFLKFILFFPIQMVYSAVIQKIQN